MACDIEEISVAVPCQYLESYTVQRRLLAQGLCLVLQALDAEATCDFTVWAEQAPCISAASSRQKQAQVLQEGLDLDWQYLRCYSEAQIEAIITNLLCLITTEVNP